MLQICDTAFPSGSLANSLGLESALAHGIVTRGHPDDSLHAFVCLTLEQMAHQSLPFVRAAHAATLLRRNADVSDSPTVRACLCEVDHVCSVVTLNEVARRSSLNQGKCFLRACSAAFAHRPYSGIIDMIAATVSLGKMHGHYPVVFGAMCGLLGISVCMAERMMLRCALRDLASCAARLNVIGPLEGASLQARLGEFVVEALLNSSPSRWCTPPSPGSLNLELLSHEAILQRLLTDDAPRVTAPVLELVQGRHDLLYARLFNS